MKRSIFKNGSFDPVACAAARIEMCEQYGLAVDPIDRKIVAGTVDPYTHEPRTD